MILQLHPRAAPRSEDGRARLQVWVGAFDADAAPALRWSIDDHLVVPRADREWTAVGRRLFTGVFQFADPHITPGKVHTLQVVEPGGAGARLETRALPSEVPDGTTDSFFNLLLVSCFHLGEDKTGRAGRLVARLPPRWRPHLSILMGDQVYLDIPTFMNYENDAQWLTGKFQEDYENNWRAKPGRNGYWDVLSAAPSAAIPDDHEYWNNFPHGAFYLPVLNDQEGRDRWEEAAASLYEAFQRPAPPTPPTPPTASGVVEIDVPPLSFLLIDSRTKRERDGSRSLYKDDLAKVRAWCKRVDQRGLFGVVATGQSLLADRHGRWRKRYVDSGLADFDDYADLVKEISALADTGRPVTLITGDVHWGRVVVGRRQGSGAASLYEIISSPSSLLTQTGKDQLSAIGNAVAWLFGRADPWPRHSDPKPAPDYFAREDLGRHVKCDLVKDLKGNQVVTISFQRSGAGLTGKVLGWRIPLDGSDEPPHEMGTLSLSPHA